MIPCDKTITVKLKQGSLLLVVNINSLLLFCGWWWYSTGFGVKKYVIKTVHVHYLTWI